MKRECELKEDSFFVLWQIWEYQQICNMKKETILSAPELTNVSDAFSKFRTLPGNEIKTSNDFYSFLVMPSVERDRFLSGCKLSPVINENIVRQQFKI